MTLSFANSSAVPVPHCFSKQQLFEELAWFMPALERSFVRLYGPQCWNGSSTVPGRSLRALQTTPLWSSLSELYDYGVHGVLPTTDELGDGSLFDAEIFLDGIDGLLPFLREDDGDIPRLAKATCELARLRHELDGSNPDQQIPAGKVALLARLTEDSVCDGLGIPPGATISVRRAREVLPQMFGFVPTGSSASPTFAFIQCVPIELPIDVIRAINERAGLTGMAPFEVLRSAFAEEINRDGYQSALAATQAALPMNFDGGVSPHSA
ncbi:MAG: hypothetical protein HY856_13885 [Burkholderiales bacterium]|nr:hypothetical protein [Burkholderiales bacterium]